MIDHPPSITNQALNGDLNQSLKMPILYINSKQTFLHIHFNTCLLSLKSDTKSYTIHNIQSLHKIQCNNPVAYTRIHVNMVNGTKHTVMAFIHKTLSLQNITCLFLRGLLCRTVYARCMKMSTCFHWWVHKKKDHPICMHYRCCKYSYKVDFMFGHKIVGW